MASLTFFNLFNLRIPMPVIYIVLFCHYLTAFTALGLPLFMPYMVTNFTDGNSQYLVGILFVIPPLCAALTAPYWGCFADKFGKKNSLLRAQSGLVIVFLLSGFADNLWIFCFGLVVQGVSGGTLAASNAYLSSQYPGDLLANKLNLTQFSARLALVTGPILLGLFVDINDPLHLYRYLALLPLFALLISLFFAPEDIPLNVEETTNSKSDQTQQNAFTKLLILQFLFCFSMVVTFPYFLPYVQTFSEVDDSFIGFYYSFPHLIYLLFAFFIGGLTLEAKQQVLFGFSFILLAGVAQFNLISIHWLIWCRLVFGIGILLCYSGLHLLLSQRLHKNKEGVSFGRFDAWGKWAGVFAGLIASVNSYYIPLNWSFLVSAIASFFAILILIFGHEKQS